MIVAPHILLITLRVAALIAGAFLGVAYSQEQFISQEMFEAGMQRYSRPPEEWKGKARRVKRTIESNTGILREVSEYDAAGSSRRVWEGVSNGQPVNQQSITVGIISYSKMGDAKWTWKENEIARHPAHIAPFENQSSPSPPFKVEHDPAAKFEFKLGASAHKGREALVYTRIKRSSRPATTGKGLINTEIITKFWLDADGRVVKTEQRDNHRSEQFASSQYIFTEWELDPNIKIKAPIIEP